MPNITITPRSGEAYIANILGAEMAMPANTVYIRNQDFVLPKTDGLFISVGMADSKVFSNRNKTEPNVGGMLETQVVSVLESIQVDMFSRNNDALTRRWEVPAAISSIYAQQLQEIGHFKIYPITTSFTNTSETEGADRINKFSIIIKVQVWYAKQRQITTTTVGGLSYGEYFDTFDTAGEDSATIEDASNIFEFTLTEL
jgi:hypothetical protein